MERPADCQQAEQQGPPHMHAEQQEEQQQHGLQQLVAEANAAAAVAAAAAAYVPVYVLHGGSAQCAVWTLHDDRFLLTDHSFCIIEPHHSMSGPELATLCGYDAAQWTHFIKVAEGMAGQPAGASIQQVFDAAIQQPGSLTASGTLQQQGQVVLPNFAAAGTAPPGGLQLAELAGSAGIQLVGIAGQVSLQLAAAAGTAGLQLAEAASHAAAAHAASVDASMPSSWVKVYVEKTTKVNALWTNASELLIGSKKLPTFVICKSGTYTPMQPKHEVTGGDIKLLAGYANNHKWYQSVRLGQPLTAEGQLFEKDNWVCKVLDVVRRGRAAGFASAAEQLVEHDASLAESLQPGSLLQGLTAASEPDSQPQGAGTKRKRDGVDAASTDEEQTASDSPLPKQQEEDDEATGDEGTLAGKRPRSKHKHQPGGKSSARGGGGGGSSAAAAAAAASSGQPAGAAEEGGVCLTYMDKQQVQEYSLAQLKSSLEAAGVNIWHPAHWTVYCYKKSLDGGWKVHYRLEGMGRFGSRATAVEAAKKKYAAVLQLYAQTDAAAEAASAPADIVQAAAGAAAAGAGRKGKAARGRGRGSTAGMASQTTPDPLQLRLQVAPLQIPPLVLPLQFQQLTAQLSPETQLQQALAADGLLQLLATTTNMAEQMQLPSPAVAAPAAPDAATTPALKEELVATMPAVSQVAADVAPEKLTALPELQVAGNQATLESQNAVLPALVALLKELGCSTAVRELMQQVKERYSASEQGMKDFVVHYMSLWAAVDLQDAAYVKDVLRDDWGLAV